MPKEAKARILINELLQRSDWRFFDNEHGPANVTLETNVKLKKKALDERLYERMVAREDSVKALNKARASGGDVGRSNADLLQKSLDYVTSFGLFQKDGMAARRAMAAVAKLKEAGPQTPDAFLKKVFRGLSYDLYAGCPDPISTCDEVDVYSQVCKLTCFIGVPVTGGDYNAGVVRCRARSLDAVAQALCRMGGAK